MRDRPARTRESWKHPIASANECTWERAQRSAMCGTICGTRLRCKHRRVALISPPRILLPPVPRAKACPRPPCRCQRDAGSAHAPPAQARKEKSGGFSSPLEQVTEYLGFLKSKARNKQAERDLEWIMHLVASDKLYSIDLRKSNNNLDTEMSQCAQRL